MRRPLVTALIPLALLLVAEAAQAAQPRIDLAGDAAPRPFELNASDPVSLPFAAATPGPVHIDIVSRGAVTVTLVRGNGKRVTQSGSGAFSIDDQVTAEDVAQGQIWDISVRATKAGGSVSGTVAVRHPAGDSNSVNAQLQRFAQRPKPPKPQPQPPSSSANAAQILATQKAQLARDVAARHLAEITRVRNDLPPEVVSIATARANLLGQGRTVDEINAQAPVRVNGVAASDLKANVAATRVAPNVSALMTQTPPPAASTPPASTPIAPLPAPDMQFLSVSQGDPGTTVIIRGQNFGPECVATGGGNFNCASGVHFVVANGIDRKANVFSWTDNKIVAEVPYQAGIPEYAGQVYVKTLDGQTSAPAGFDFLPAMDVATLYMPPITQNGPDHYAFADSTLSDDIPVAFLEVPGYAAPNAGVDRFSGFFGNASNDTFYNTRQLQNGWKVKSCDTTMSDGKPGIETSDPNSASASITECRVGTSSPFVKMHWWMDGGYYLDDDFLEYGFSVTITGPVGMPY